MDKDLMLTEEDYKALGFTPEQIELFNEVNVYADAINELPDDPKVMTDILDNQVPDDFVEALSYLEKLATKNPEVFANIMTMADLVTDLAPSSPAADPVLEKLSNEELDKAEYEFYTMIKDLSPERKREFFEVLESATIDQKAELVKKLLK